MTYYMPAFMPLYAAVNPVALPSTFRAAEAHRARRGEQRMQLQTHTAVETMARLEREKTMGGPLDSANPFKVWGGSGNPSRVSVERRQEHLEQISEVLGKVL